MAFFISFIVGTILISFLLVALIAVWVYRDAKSRGLSAGLWALVSILANIPIGLLIYLLLGRKDKPVITKPVKARPYLIGGILCFVIMIGSMIGFVTYSIFGDMGGMSFSSGYSTGMIQNNWNGEWTMRFKYSNATHNQRVRLPEGVPLTAEASCSEGTITLMVTTENYSEMFRLSEGEIVNLTFPPDAGRTSASVGLILDCANARDGDVRIRWK